MVAVPLYRSAGCFACGTDNPHGFGLAPQREGNRVYATFTPRPEHRGYARAVHGGITCTLLDEVSGLACSQRVDGKCATVSLTVEFKRPILVGREITIEGTFVRRRGRVLYSTGRIVDGEGAVLARCRGKFLHLDEQRLGRFVEP